MTAEEFVRRLRDYTGSGAADAKFAFFVGAGCSIDSGIPAATALVRDRWLPRLRDIRDPAAKDLAEWVKREFGFDTQNLPNDAYGKILTELLPHPSLRQEEVEALCKAGRPSFGYATLAQLVAEFGSLFNVVLTTNFDDLVADALYLFTGVHPLLIHHGALSPYIKVTPNRPLIVKLHGHHQFSALNTHEETQAIDPDLTSGVHPLLRDRGLIFLGYGGNDDGIKRLLSDLPMTHLPYGIYWVSGSEPDNLLTSWLRERKAIWVNHRGFEELMVHVRGVFQLPMPEVQRVQELFDSVQQSYISLSTRIHSQTPDEPGVDALKSAAERVDNLVTDWAVYELRAQRYMQTDPEKAKANYEEGLHSLPDSVPLRGNYANFLRLQDEFDDADRQYQLALERDPNFPNVLHDYGIFLWRSVGRIDEAREYLEKARQYDSGDNAIRISNYANFVWEVEHDIPAAEALHREAVSLPLATHEPFRQFALFAQIALLDYPLAENLYSQALSRKPNDVVALVNFSHLAATRGDIDTALEVLERAYAVDDHDINVVGSLAKFLWDHRIDLNRSSALFNDALSTIPKDFQERKYFASLLVSYSQFQMQEGEDPERAKVLLSEAIELFPDDPDLIAAKASYEAHISSRAQESCAMIDEAIERLGEHGVLFGTKAQLIWLYEDNLAEVVRLNRYALELDSDLLNAKCNLAAALFAMGEIEEPIDLCNDVIRRAGRAYPALAVECFFFLYVHGPKSKRIESLKILKWLLTDRAMSKGWNLAANVSRAIKDGHDQAAWLGKLASVVCGEKDIQILTGWHEWNLAPMME